MATRNAKTGTGGQRRTCSESISCTSGEAVRRLGKRAVLDSRDPGRQSVAAVASAKLRRPVLLVRIDDIVCRPLLSDQLFRARDVDATCACNNIQWAANCTITRSA